MAGITSLIPLFILFAVVGIFGYVGYQMFVWSNELADRGRKKMEGSNMSFTQDGLRVNVKGMSNENYADKTQKTLVGVWNNAAFPNYKSKLGWNSTQADTHHNHHHKSSPNASPRPGNSRQNSDSSRPSGSRTNSGLRVPEHRSSAKRSASPVPGGWD